MEREGERKGTKSSYRRSVLVEGKLMHTTANHVGLVHTQGKEV